MNGVFRAGPAVLRVGLAGSHAAAASQVALAGLLHAHGIPAPEPFDGAVFDAGGRPATAWRWFDHDPAREPDWAALGRVAARVHALDAAEVGAVVALVSPTSFPWLQLQPSLDALAAGTFCTPPDLDHLRRHWQRLQGWADEVRAAPAVVCHGDLHPNNVLVGASGWLLIDWDAVCLAPPAWDHAPLAHWADRWGGPARARAGFAQGYGADLAATALGSRLAELRLFAATVMLARRAESDARVAAEARLRLRYWAGDPDAPAWTSQ